MWGVAGRRTRARYRRLLLAGASIAERPISGASGAPSASGRVPGGETDGSEQIVEWKQLWGKRTERPVPHRRRGREIKAVPHPAAQVLPHPEVEPQALA